MQTSVTWSWTNKEHLASNDSPLHRCTPVFRPCCNNCCRELRLLTFVNIFICDLFEKGWKDRRDMKSVSRTFFFKESKWSPLVDNVIFSWWCLSAHSVIQLASNAFSASWHFHVILMMKAKERCVPFLCFIRAGVSNSRPGGQIRPATSFYVALKSMQRI